MSTLFWASAGLAALAASPFSFDDGWRFRRGPCAPGVCSGVDVSDSDWRAVTVPHDWSREDLPPREDDREFPTVPARYLAWRLAPGDNASWADPAFNDSDWASAVGGVDWREYGAAFAAPNATGWYRAALPVPAWMAAAPTPPLLSIGVVAGADDVWVNGVHVGSTQLGAQADYTTFRRYALPAGVIKPAGPNVIAVRVRAFSFARRPNVSAGGLYDDASIGSAAPARSGPFDAAASPGQAATGFTLGGAGWYRKRFDTPLAVRSPVHGGRNSRALLRFDGVYMNASVFVNGELVGVHPYGYTPVEYDVTAFLSQSGNFSNVVAVSVANTGENSRWYAGSGLYRHTWLSVVDGAVSIPTDGVVVSTRLTSTPARGRTASAALTVAVEVRNTGGVPVTGATLSVKVRVQEAGGPVVASVSGVAVGRLAGNATVVVLCNTSLPTAQLWSPSTPVLYAASASVLAPSLGGVVDTAAALFGVRSINFSADRGFELNGETIKMRGGCVHHGNGPLGAMAIDHAEERRVAALKALGYNAVRTAHNPPSPAFLDACDRLGMLVIDEAFDCWAQGKNPNDYHTAFWEWWRRDLTAMVRRDRNHPSVVMYSIGNEIPMRFTKAGLNLSLQMGALVRAVDTPGSGRAITSAYPMLNDQDSAFLHSLDVAGYNYAGWTHGVDVYAEDHRRLPNRVMVGTESLPSTSWTQWDRIGNKSYVVGDFIWTAIDYLGESSIASDTDDGGIDQTTEREPYPFHSSNSGDLDITLAPKPQSVYRQVLWNVTDIGVLVHRPVPPGVTEVQSPWGWPDERVSWTWPGHEGSPLQVRVFARGCKTVSVSVNGALEGTAAFGANLTAVLVVKYSPGTMTVTTDGCVDCSQERSGCAAPATTLRTAGRPAGLRLAVDRNSIAHDANDLAFVTVHVLDATGIEHPDAAVPVTFSVIGPGALIAVGNGDPRDVTSFTAPNKTTWRGRALAVVQPDTAAGAGTLTIRAHADGMADVSVVVTTTAPTPTPAPPPPPPAPPPATPECNGTVVRGVNPRGDDLARVPLDADNPAGCVAACCGLPACAAYVLMNATASAAAPCARGKPCCYLKGAHPEPPRADPYAVASGHVSRSAPPPPTPPHRSPFVFSGTPDAVPVETDCAIRKAAFAYGKHLLPRRGAFRALFDALQLGSCGMQPPPPDPADGPSPPPPLTDDLPRDRPVLWVDNRHGARADDVNGGGTTPHATLQGALDHSRSLPHPVTIVLRQGRHTVPAGGLRLTAEDSGLHIRSAPGERATVSGGVPLGDLPWQPSAACASRVRGCFETSLARVANLTNRTILGLRLDGVREIRARFPNFDPEFNQVVNGTFTVHDGRGGMVNASTPWVLADPNSTMNGVAGGWPPKAPATTYVVSAKHWPGVDWPTAETANGTAQPDSWTGEGDWGDFYIGVGGTCVDRAPAAGYWCSPGAPRRISVPGHAAGVVLTPAQLPHLPYANPKGAVIHAWGRYKWYTNMFEIGGRRNATFFAFSRGGTQGAEGTDPREEPVWYVENVLEELDAPREWHVDESPGSPRRLVYLPNTTSGKPEGDFVAVVEPVLFNLTGTQTNPVRDVVIEGLTLRDAALTYLDPHGLPSGGDWALRKSGAVTLVGTAGVVVRNNQLTRLDGTAVFVGGFACNLTVENNDFYQIGESAMASWGDTSAALSEDGSLPELPFPMGPDGRNGNQPRGTVVRGNAVEGVGVWQKQSSAWFQAVTAQTVLEGNVLFNGPRAGVNFNDGFGGGDVMQNNLLANWVRESKDHGCFNAWDRQPYITRVRNGTASIVPAERLIRSNFFLANYNAQEAIDTDDGSSYYSDVGNFLAYAGNGLKSDFGGHNHRAVSNVYAYVGGCLGAPNPLGRYFHGYNDAFVNNSCVAWGQGYGAGVYTSDCFLPPSFNVSHNRVYTQTGDSLICGHTWPEWRNGTTRDKSSTIARWPSDAELIAWASALLNASLE